MAIDMKESIMQAAISLMVDRKKKKLTVKDIVEVCHITRQTFYYHFEDIPHLMRYIFEQRGRELADEIEKTGDLRVAIRSFLVLASNAKPAFTQALNSNYAQELHVLLKEDMYQVFMRLIREKHLLEGLGQDELELFVRYNNYAILGFVADWEPEDMKNLDQITETAYRLMMRGESLLGGSLMQSVNREDADA